jgi:hypothetical protein
MKYLVTFLMMFLPAIAIAQETDTGEIDYNQVFITFAALSAAVPFVVEGIKKLIPAIDKSKIATIIVSWVIPILVTMFGWVFDLGFLAERTWWQALLYGLGAGLVSNGLFSTGLIEWIIGLFIKKTDKPKV